ncbi:MAG: hypothetical protein K2P79_04720 [Sphingomonas sp.]|nr:hypothetical protein [Sphingomonas sp.]
MRHWTVSAAIGAAILSSSAGSGSPGQIVVSGIYVLDENRSDNAFQAIASATADLPDAKRPLARARLRKSTAVSRLRISTAGSRVGIAYDAKAPIVVWIGEEPTKWKLAEGFVFDVSAKANGDAIFLTFRDDNSERTTTYHSVGQDLVADTTIIIPLLSTPIVYRQIYNRTN